MEVYDLSDDGKTVFAESIKFHRVGNEPLYKALVTKSGLNYIYLKIRYFYYVHNIPMRNF